MEYFDIYYILDHNDCPPTITYFDTSKHQHDCLAKIRDSDKDLDLIDIERVKVKRKPKDIVEFINREARLNRYLTGCYNGKVDSSHFDDEPPTPTKRHLQLVQ